MGQTADSQNRRADASSPRRPAPRPLLALLTGFNLAFLLFLWPLEMWLAERHWLTTLIAYAPQHLFGLPAVILTLCAGCPRQWRTLAWNLIALCFFALTLLGYNLPIGSSSAAAGPRVRVMTYNVLEGRRGPAQLADAISRLNSDVLCLQEARVVGASQSVLPRGLEFHCARHGELATLSRYRMVSHRVHELSPRLGRVVLETVLDVDGRRLTVLNVHFATAAPRQSLTRRSVSLPAYLAHTAQVRGEQASALLSIANHLPGPVIVAGDFNTPPRGLVYGRLAGRFQDAFRVAGWGLGHTFRSDIPVWRIDYLFASPDIHIVDCRVADIQASDHRPVVADVALAVPR